MTDVLPDPRELAAVRPPAAKRMITKVAEPLPASELAPFFEHACRELAGAGLPELAQWAFGQARKIDVEQPSTFDLDRVHGVFLELVPTGAVPPAALRGHAKVLAERLPPAEAYDRFREVLCAGFDAGLVPYANVFPDVRKLARPAKVKKRAAEEWLAERMLRAGVLPIASHLVWTAAREPLVALAARDEELLKLLVAAEPDPDLHEEEIAQEIRHMWLECLVEAGAGAHLPPEWFSTSGRACPARLLLTLLDQAGERLLPPDAAPLDWDEDPALSHPDFRPILPFLQDTGGFPRWDRAGFDMAALAAEVEDTAGYRFEVELDAFIRDLGTFGGVDYLALIRRLWEQRPLRQVLEGFVADWKADALRPALPALAHALSRLLPLARHGFADLDPGLSAGLDPADPVDALLSALRGGLPEELGVPSEGAVAADMPITVIQHHDHLTFGRTSWAGWAAAHADRHRQVAAVDLKQLPDSLVPWYDGERFLASRIVAGRWQTFTVEEGPASQAVLTWDAALAAARPESPSAADVTFPGATAPSRVRLHRGILTVTAPDGTPTARLDYLPHKAQTGPFVPPPGWWARRDPVDPTGSAALRHTDRETAGRLLEAALGGPKAAAEYVARALPEVTEPKLRDGVVKAAVTAAQCLVRSMELRERLGLPRPEALPMLVVADPALPFRPLEPQVESMVRARLVAHELERALAEPDMGRPYLVRTIPWGESGGGLGGTALRMLWRWTSDAERARLRGTLLAYANAPLAGGTGRWRTLEFTPNGAGRLQGVHTLEEHERAELALQETTVGRLWRTPNGVLLFSGYQHGKRTAYASEYSPDGRFSAIEVPEWRSTGLPLPSWGTADQIVRLLRAADEHGPLPFDPAVVHELAGRTGLPVADAARLCYGVPGEDCPADVLACYRDPQTGEPVPTRLSPPDRKVMREMLMPDEPERLWTAGPDIGRAAAWWAERKGVAAR
ncbi:hypothetical protein SAMN04489712_104557 [Thermomonospora echinospora]|uniref:Uncharacterized protein n=1 Tax=Thermomonospora echinospora TaxID=1992 RepID=A0A1H5ZGX1_9ACTN|nr:hypothetical protein [Thermomonospora echinospora]SEG35709.1 hypothetical protein SAMN04489712_104557 [Thermomonospora echinospora]